MTQLAFIAGFSLQCRQLDALFARQSTGQSLTVKTRSTIPTNSTEMIVLLAGVNVAVFSQPPAASK
jgi:hypothetical protein